MGDRRLLTTSGGSGRRAARTTSARRARTDAEILEALRAELDAMTRARPELLSLLSHDLKNTLNIVTMSTELLARAIGADHPARRHAEMIRRATDELNQMLERTSEAARIERGQLHLDVGEHDAAGLLDEAARAVERAAQSKGLAIEVTVAERLPPVPCDRARIVGVLADLLGRALRVTPKTGSIAARAERDEDGGIRFSIADSGAPVDARHHEAIFEVPGTQEQRRAGGQCFALDLFVARGIVEGHGGRIGVESTAGQGNVLHFTLPVA
jgi:signal transduction histidine kinase